MYLIVAYDISKDKKRNKFAKELLKFGIRTQKSVFECDIEEKEVKIIKKLANKFSSDGDFVTIYKTNKSKIKREGRVDNLEINHLVF